VNEEALAHWGTVTPERNKNLKSKPSIISLFLIINLLNKHKVLLSIVNFAEGIHAC
jgi:hypothetical protein